MVTISTDFTIETSYVREDEAHFKKKIIRSVNF